MHFTDQLETDLYTVLPAMGDLRRALTGFYQSFSSSGDTNSPDFQPVFLTPYYDLFGLSEEKQEGEGGREGGREGKGEREKRVWQQGRMMKGRKRIMLVILYLL